MKKSFLSIFCVAALLCSCGKSDKTETITLTASATETTVGTTISVTASTSANALSWSANPASAASKVYSTTTEKTNYFTFSQPGDYTVGVRVRELRLDSVHHCNYADSINHHIPDSIWHHRIDSMWRQNGFHLGGCRKGQDSASIVIKVK